MDKFKHLANLEQEVNYPNLDDWKESFWKHNYLIHLTAQNILFAVNANHEQEAIDYIIDYCEKHFPGLLLTHEEADEEAFLDEYICGGNHGRYLNTEHIRIEPLD